MKEFIKKWWIMPVSIIVAYIAIFEVMITVWILDSKTDNLIASYICAFLFWGCFVSLPIMIRIGLAKKTKLWKRIILMIAVTLVVTGVLFFVWL